MTLVREVGEPIYLQDYFSIRSRFLATLPIAVDAALDQGQRLMLPEGYRAQLQTRTHGGALALCASAHPNRNLTGCLIDVDKNGIFESAMFANREVYYALSPQVAYVVASSDEQTSLVPTAKKDLLYQGLQGDAIRLSYREFTESGMARPAFSQELTYTLARDGTAEIGFRGFRARVLQATNLSITLIVDRPM